MEHLTQSEHDRHGDEAVIVQLGPPLYLAKILYERTDEDHYLTTMQLAQILEEEYGIPAHRQTIKTDIELLQQFGMDIQEVKSTQNRYNLISRQFEIA